MRLTQVKAPKADQDAPLPESPVIPPPASATVKVEEYVDQTSEYRWRAKTRNGRVVAACAEGYKTLAKLRKAIKIVFGSFVDVVELSTASKRAK